MIHQAALVSMSDHYSDVDGGGTRVLEGGSSAVALENLQIGEREGGGEDREEEEKKVGGDSFSVSRVGAPVAMRAEIWTGGGGSAVRLGEDPFCPQKVLASSPCLPPSSSAGMCVNQTVVRRKFCCGVGGEGGGGADGGADADCEVEAAEQEEANKDGKQTDEDSCSRCVPPCPPRRPGSVPLIRDDTKSSSSELPEDEGRVSVESAHEGTDRSPHSFPSRLSSSFPESCPVCMDESRTAAFFSPSPYRAKRLSSSLPRAKVSSFSRPESFSDTETCSSSFRADRGSLDKGSGSVSFDAVVGVRPELLPPHPGRVRGKPERISSSSHCGSGSVCRSAEDACDFPKGSHSASADATSPPRRGGGPDATKRTGQECLPPFPCVRGAETAEPLGGKKRNHDDCQKEETSSCFLSVGEESVAIEIPGGDNEEHQERILAPSLCGGGWRWLNKEEEEETKATKHARSTSDSTRSESSFVLARSGQLGAPARRPEEETEHSFSCSGFSSDASSAGERNGSFESVHPAGVVASRSEVQSRGRRASDVV